MTRGSSDLPSIAGLYTLLEKADLLDRHSDVTRCCADLGVKKLVDLHLERVRQELSKSLALDFVENEKLRAECADEAILRAYAASNSGPAFGSGSDQRQTHKSPEPSGSANLLDQSRTPNSPDPGGSVNLLDVATSRASSSSSTWHGRHPDDDPRRHAVAAHRREIITMCIEGDYSAFDEAHERRLRKLLACEIDAELDMDQIKIVKPTLPTERAKRIGTNRCRIKVQVDERGRGRKRLA
jgi:hypothetical protein